MVLNLVYGWRELSNSIGFWLFKDEIVVWYITSGIGINRYKISKYKYGGSKCWVGYDG